MAVTSIEVFDFALKRANHFLKLHDILHNSRQRSGRADWLDKFKKLVGWPVGETVTRIDGKDKQSILLLRESVGVDREHFAHEYTSEILRSSVVAAISALDKYMHDIVVEQCWKLLNGPEKNIPKELAALKVPVLATKKALDRVRVDGKSRPGSQIKLEIQEMLHREFTFQNVHGIEKGAKMLGIKNFWQTVADEMPNTPSKGEVQKQLTKIARRRNKIVHEADIVRKISARNIAQNAIDHKEASDMVNWVKEFVYAMNRVFCP
jgi:hypothetical protein